MCLPYFFFFFVNFFVGYHFGGFCWPSAMSFLCTLVPYYLRILRFYLHRAARVDEVTSKYRTTKHAWMLYAPYSLEVILISSFQFWNDLRCPTIVLKIIPVRAYILSKFNFMFQLKFVGSKFDGFYAVLVLSKHHNVVSTLYGIFNFNAYYKSL